uniref:Speckle-type POZ protein (inferred by orthology to a human protein) n=1 Tax=Strongyloides venezuelensis TaxID=75913 RepID=A0A0K0FI14_STRVS
MDSKNLAYSEVSNVDCNAKNTVIKRASFIRIIENFPICSGYSPICNLYDCNTGKKCGYDQKCQKCRDQGRIIDNGYTSKYQLDCNVKCSLSIYPIGHVGIESDDYVSLHLQFTGFNRIKIVVLCKFSILNLNGKEEYKSVVGVEKFDTNKNSYYFEKFIKINDLLERKNILLPNGRLTLCFEIFYLFCDDEYVADVSEATHIGGPLNIFLNGMSKMLNSSEYFDCVIKVRDSEINVHKCIIATGSEVLRSTLKNQSTEHKSNVIEINDFSLEAVKEMVSYLYTGRSPKINEIAIEMLEIAEKYKLEGLKMIAAESLFKILSVKNVCEYLEKSELCSAEILKEFCIRYIYLNAEEVVKSEKWKRIFNLYPLLVARILNVAVYID